MYFTYYLPCPDFQYSILYSVVRRVLKGWKTHLFLNLERPIFLYERTLVH